MTLHLNSQHKDGNNFSLYFLPGTIGRIQPKQALTLHFVQCNVDALEILAELCSKINLQSEVH